MFKFFVCVSLLMALAIADYDFQDSDYNILLFDELTAEVENNFSEPQRSRRTADNDTECHRRRGSAEIDAHCCNGETGDPQELPALKETKRNCIAEVRGESADVSFDPLNCAGVQSMRQQMICVGECMAKNFNLLTDSGDFERDALLSHTRKIVGANEWKASVLEEYVDRCLTELELKKAEADIGECNPKPLEFHYCIWKEFVQGCPADSQLDSRKCRKIRDRLANGQRLNRRLLRGFLKQ